MSFESSSGGWDESAQGWIEHIDRGDINREAVLDPAMLDRCGDVRGLKVLDVGCGEGRFCRTLSSRGAHVVGLDPTIALLEEARRRHPEGAYVAGFAEQMPFEEGAYDLVVSYVSLIDITDYKKAILEMARVLRAGGRLLVANLNGFATSVPTGWVEDDSGHRLHFPVDNYSEERPEWVAWRNIRIVNWHRPLSSYMKALLEAGFRLTFFDEPAPDAEALAKYPKAIDYFRVPYFNVMEWSKKA